MRMMFDEWVMGALSSEICEGRWRKLNPSWKLSLRRHVAGKWIFGSWKKLSTMKLNKYAFYLLNIVLYNSFQNEYLTDIRVCLKKTQGFQDLRTVCLQVCVVQPKAEIDAQFESQRLSTLTGYTSALLLGITTFGTISIMSGFFLTPGATYDDYVSRVLPLFTGYLAIFEPQRYVNINVSLEDWSCSKFVVCHDFFSIPSLLLGAHFHV